MKVIPAQAVTIVHPLVALGTLAFVGFLWYREQRELERELKRRRSKDY